MSEWIDQQSMRNSHGEISSQNNKLKITLNHFLNRRLAIVKNFKQMQQEQVSTTWFHKQIKLCELTDKQ